MDMSSLSSSLSETAEANIHMIGGQAPEAVMDS